MRRASLGVANQWLNDPRIRPFCGVGNEPFDLAPIWHDVVVFEFPTGTVGFHRQGGGIWNAHLCLVPGAGNAKEYARQALREMFSRDDCQMVIGVCSKDNARTARFGHGMGFAYLGSGGGQERFAMTRDNFKDGERKWAGAKQSAQESTPSRETSSRPQPMTPPPLR